MSWQPLLHFQTHIFLWGSTLYCTDSVRLNLPSLCVCCLKTTAKTTDSPVVRAIQGTQGVLSSLSLYVHDGFMCAWMTRIWGQVFNSVQLWFGVSEFWVSVFLKLDFSSGLSPAQRARVGKGSIITRGIPPQNGNWKWIQRTLLTSDLQLKQRQREGEMEERGRGWRQKIEECVCVPWGGAESGKSLKK